MYTVEELERFFTLVKTFAVRRDGKVICVLFADSLEEAKDKTKEIFGEPQ